MNGLLFMLLLEINCIKSEQDAPSISTNTVSATVTTTSKIARQTPAQDALSVKIALERKKVSIMYQQLESGLGNVSKKDILKVEEGIRVIDRELNRKKSLAAASQKLRNNRKSNMTEVLEENPNIAKKLKMREAIGQPRLEVDQVDLLQTIKTLAIFGGAADDKASL